jgi:hypothetical protein
MPSLPLRIFPQLPLYAGGMPQHAYKREIRNAYGFSIFSVLITAVDVLFVLAFFQRPERGRKGMMAFEGLIVSLVRTVFSAWRSRG